MVRTSGGTQNSYSLKHMMTFLIRHLVFGSGPQAHRASSSINIRMQDEPISSAQGSRPRRRRRHHGQTPPSDQPQSTVQQILHPGNLLRRLLPSSSPFKSDSQASWAKKNCWVKKKNVKYCTWEGERLGNAMHAGVVGVKKTGNEVLIKKPHNQKSLPGRKVMFWTYCSGQTCSSVNGIPRNSY